MIYSDVRQGNEEFFKYLIKLNNPSPEEIDLISTSERQFYSLSNLLEKCGIIKLIKSDSYGLNIKLTNAISISYLAIVDIQNSDFIQHIAVNIVDKLYECCFINSYINENCIKIPEIKVEINLVNSRSDEFIYEQWIQNKSLSDNIIDVLKVLRIWKRNKVEISNKIIDIVAIYQLHDCASVSIGFRICIEAISGGILLLGNSLELEPFHKNFISKANILILQELAQNTLILLSEDKLQEIFE